MRIVIDTNVLISGLLTPNGKCAEILRAVLGESVDLCLDERILREYREVAARERLGIPYQQRNTVIEHLEATGIKISAAPLTKPLPDESDEPFLAVAVSGRANFLVTGNLKHFPKRHRQGINVVSPSEFVDVLRRLSGGKH